MLKGKEADTHSQTLPGGTSFVFFFSSAQASAHIHPFPPAYLFMTLEKSSYLGNKMAFTEGSQQPNHLSV